MKKRATLWVAGLMAVALTMGVAGSAWGHAPGTINVNFDPQTKIVRIEVVHLVGAPARHYVNEIEVWLNDELMIRQYFNRQTGPKAQRVQYVMIDAHKGDTLKIKASCNLKGSHTRTLVL